MDIHDCDVIVVGAGFAGAAAARELARAGLKTIILEARKRVGGRAYTRQFEAANAILEYGGSWVTPWHDRIRAHAESNGMKLRPTHRVIEHRMHDGETLRSGTPCAAPEEPSYRAAMQQIRTDAAAYQAGDRRWVSTSFNGYLDSIKSSRAARVQASAWWTISGNGDPDHISAAEFLSSCAYGGGLPEGMMNVLRHTLEPGASVLVERMIARSKAELRVGCGVARIGQNENGVRIRTVEGESLVGRSVVVCVPLNTISTIEFRPQLRPRQKLAVQTGHGGCAIKLWIAASKVPVGILATGGGRGIQWMFAERSAEDATLIVAFALNDGSLDPNSRPDISAALHRFFPEAGLIGWDWHDWSTDPWSRGTWVAVPADAPWIADSAEWHPHHRAVFASSDFSPESPGWFEAAIVAGERAAQTASASIQR